MSKEDTLRRNEILQGTLDLLVLEVLRSEQLHGYAIRERLAELSKEFLQVEEGSLYPCLYRMERRGWIRSELGRSENNRRARFYYLTRAGREELKREHRDWSDFVEAVSRVFSGKES